MVTMITQLSKQKQPVSPAWGAAGKFLELLREARGLKPYQAARKVGYSTKQLRRWEAGTHEPPYGVLRDLLKILQCPPEVFDAIFVGTNQTQDDGIRAAGALLADGPEALRQAREKLAMAMNDPGFVAVYQQASETAEGRAAIADAARRYLESKKC